MPINFETIDKNIYSDNSVFFSGSFNNTAIKVAAVAVTISSLGASVYLIAIGLPFPSVVLISGTIIVDTAGSHWYQYRVNEIQSATKELFDYIFANGKEDEMRALLKINDISIYRGFSPKSFFDNEFLLRLKTILKEKENFQKNFPKLISLLNSYFSVGCGPKYYFLADQILELDDENKKFILNQDSPEIQQFIQDMMVEIQCPTIFTEFYKFIPDSMRKNILISLADLCYERMQERVSRWSGFHLALKLTPKLPSIVRKIFSENPQVKEQFCAALSKVFSEEFSCVKEIEASSRFLIDLYPFLNEANIARAFYVDTEKENPLSLKLWMEVVSKTRAAAVRGNFTDSLFHMPYYLSPSFYEFFLENWCELEEGLNAICQNFPVETPFSLFVHLLSSRFSNDERAYVQQLKVSELGTLAELHPRFLYVWVENKHISFSEFFLEFIQNRPSPSSIINFFKTLTLEQKFGWIQSTQRQSIDFRKAGLLDYQDLSKIVIQKELQVERQIREHPLDGDSSLFDRLRSHNEMIKESRLLLQQKGLSKCLIEKDLSLLWEDIQAKKTSEKIEWMKKLYIWSLKAGKGKAIVGLIYVEQALDHYDYVKEFLGRNFSDEGVVGEGLF